MQRLTDKVALITGGAGRIGKATGRRMTEEGARVALADISLDAAKAAAADLPGAIAIGLDAGSPESVEAMVAECIAHFGRLDILHNNAALTDLESLGKDKTVVDTPVAVWDRTMEVNLRAYMVACQAAIPHMRGNGSGVIVNTASNAALAGDDGRIAYGTSKGAIITMTKYIATQHGREGIRCNAIMPGLILDPDLESKLPELSASVKRHLLVDRNGLPEDIAALATFLASNDAAFITGQAISCDGGLLVHLPFYADNVPTG